MAHKFDKEYHELNKNCRNRNQQNNLTNKEESADEILILLFAQLEGKCYGCRKTGHNSTQCWHKNKLKSEWVINKVKRG